MQERSKIMVYYSGILLGSISLYRFLAGSDVNRQPISVFYAHEVMKYSITAFPVTLCLMYVLAGKFVWKNEKTFQNCDLTTKKRAGERL